MSRVSLFLAGLTLLIGFHPGYAQGQPRLLDVRIVTVKPNRIAEWAELQHQLNAALAEAGLSPREFWQVEEVVTLPAVGAHEALRAIG